MSDLLTGQDFLDGQLHLLPVHSVGDLSDGQHQGGNVPTITNNKIIFKKRRKITLKQSVSFYLHAIFNNHIEKRASVQVFRPHQLLT